MNSNAANDTIIAAGTAPTETISVGILTDEEIQAADGDALVAANQDYMNAVLAIHAEQGRIKRELNRRHFEAAHKGMTDAEEKALIDKLVAQGKIQVVDVAGIAKAPGSA